MPQSNGKDNRKLAFMTLSIAISIPNQPSKCEKITTVLSGTALALPAITTFSEAAILKVKI